MKVASKPITIFPVKFNCPPLHTSNESSAELKWDVVLDSDDVADADVVDIDVSSKLKNEGIAIVLEIYFF